MRNLIRATALAAALTLPLAASAAHHRGAGDSGSGARLTQMCEAGSRDIAGLPIEQIQRSTQVTGDARAAAAVAGASVVRRRGGERHRQRGRQCGSADELAHRRYSAVFL